MRKPMTWNQAKAKADQIMSELRAQHQPADVRLVLRALSRQHHKENIMNTTNIPTNNISGAITTRYFYVGGAKSSGCRRATVALAKKLRAAGLLVIGGESHRIGSGHSRYGGMVTANDSYFETNAPRSEVERIAGQVAMDVYPEYLPSPMLLQLAVIAAGKK